jgi:small subunit ribosomal protein S2
MVDPFKPPSLPKKRLSVSSRKPNTRKDETLNAYKSKPANAHELRAAPKQRQLAKKEKEAKKEPKEPKELKMKAKKRKKRRLTLASMLKAGMHLGHVVRRWNPQMRPFIHSQYRNIHLLNLVKTKKCLGYACHALKKETSNGGKILFVATKKQAALQVQQSALACNSAYVNQKWLGGILTNWKTVKGSIETLRRLDIQERSGYLFKLPKKEYARKLKQKNKLESTIGGLKHVLGCPTMLVIIGQHEEFKALNECRRLKMPSITLLDTDCDPRKADLYIPANDDSVSSIGLVLRYLVPAIRAGQALHEKKMAQELRDQEQQARRLRRSKFTSRKKTPSTTTLPKNITSPKKTTSKR